MATRKVLGLDLGVSSIGWALIEMDEDTPQQILAMGSRIVPLSSDDSDQFQKGQAITKNADRTQRRTARKGYDRYQQRRALLTEVLRRNNMLPQRMDEHIIDLWGVRGRAGSCRAGANHPARVGACALPYQPEARLQACQGGQLGRQEAD